MTFGRMASDNEIIALRSCGKHPVRIIIPAVMFGVLAAGVCLWLEIAIIPAVNRSVTETTTALQEQKAFLSLAERSFQNLGKDMVMYVQRGKGVDGKAYEGILITDHSMSGHSRVIVASEGDIDMDESAGTVVFSLREGSVHTLEREGDGGYQVLRFGTYENAFFLGGPPVLRTGKKKYKELSLRDLSAMLRSDSVDLKEEIGLRLEWHRRFAFPVACIIFAFIGSLIGMESRWSGRSSSFAVSIAVIIAYYLVLTAGSRLSTAGCLPAWIAAWLPNIAFAVTGVVLFRGVF
jgi:lipopolysaccharide export LptBFGC system permease protein LptF